MNTSPLLVCGSTPDGRGVLGGAFKLHDTHGFPLSFSMDQAEKHGCVISIPHFFSSALEHGWDDDQTFRSIREALSDSGKSEDMESIREKCVFMFMQVANTMPENPVVEIASKMREMIEHGDSFDIPTKQCD